MYSERGSPEAMNEPKRKRFDDLEVPPPAIVDFGPPLWPWKKRAKKAE